MGKVEDREEDSDDIISTEVWTEDKEAEVANWPSVANTLIEQPKRFRSVVATLVGAFTVVAMAVGGFLWLLTNAGYQLSLELGDKVFKLLPPNQDDEPPEE